jgi:hypothetical protein
MVSHELAAGKYIVSGDDGVISASFFLQLLDNNKIIKKMVEDGILKPNEEAKLAS